MGNCIFDTAKPQINDKSTTTMIPNRFPPGRQSSPTTDQGTAQDSNKKNPVVVIHLNLIKKLNTI